MAGRHPGPGASPDLRLPGLFFLVIGAAFLIVTMLAASIAPGYDFHDGKISDLGVIPETAGMFNLLLIGIGILNVVAGALTDRVLGARWLLAASLVGGVGAAGAGLFPLDRGGLHSLFALAAFVGFNLQALAAAVVVRSGPLRGLSALAGLVGLAYVVVMLVGDAGNQAVFGAIGHGGSERMIAYPVMAWLLALGGSFIAQPGSTSSGVGRPAP